MHTSIEPASSTSYAPVSGGTLPVGAHAAIRAEGLALARGERTLFTGLDLTITARSRLAIVGENGRGKSSLFSVLTHSLTPDAGTVHTIGTWGVARQELDVRTTTTVGELTDEAIGTARDALAAFDTAAAALASDAAGESTEVLAAYTTALERAEALDAWDAERRLDVALASLDACTDRERSLGSLSVGQRYRVRLACLLAARHDILLLDEPTNHLDANGLDFLTRGIREHPGGVALVSHDRTLLREVAREFLDLDPTEDGRPALYSGGYDAWRTGRARARTAWEARFVEQTTEHRRLSEAADAARARLSTGWRPEKGTGKHQRQSRAPGVVRAVNRKQEELEAHSVTAPVPPARLRLPELSARPGRPLLRVFGVHLPGRLDEPVDLDLTGGAKIVVTGANGAGKSTLLGILAGILEPTVGHRVQAPDARVALLAQESPDDPAVRRLSEGQRRRKHIARVFAEEPNVLLIDEPTNHLAAAMVDDLTEVLRETQAAVVCATHDRTMLRELGDWTRIHLGS
ncbi:ABC-F family ATP-binding cassette domain-containing protein [Spiractinospora alimapuensis]|uniref:ATP-binding cassette domain-containing protein n=1 Tax=Spiractinospora alimapuensis TaxID=2820884 RepID=UPI001F442B4A|nr:ATP-binding cassette domain-containing protein [Spiractinospora alimapuensis]QVQ53957.1 ABC-F family ATP-binding cassette domain-containing protein [Spiractinospora alimapuensis]